MPAMLKGPKIQVSYTCDTTFNMCKKFGYLEMLGWFTSLVVRKSEFVQAVAECEKARKSYQHHTLANKPYSAFFHSGYFFQYLHKKDAAFLDEPLVCEQIASDKNKTANRWRDANTGERYLFIADDFQRLKSENINLSNLPLTVLQVSQISLVGSTYEFPDRSNLGVS